MDFLRNNIVLLPVISPVAGIFSHTHKYFSPFSLIFFPKFKTFFFQNHIVFSPNSKRFFQKHTTYFPLTYNIRNLFNSEKSSNKEYILLTICAFNRKNTYKQFESTEIINKFN